MRKERAIGTRSTLEEQPDRMVNTGEPRDLGELQRTTLQFSDPLLDVPKLAALLGLTLDAMRKMLSRGQVPPDCILKIGWRVRFDPVRVAAWLEGTRMSSAESRGDAAQPR